MESQIEMLKNQSGDLVNQLQEKIKKMTKDHEEAIALLKQQHSNERQVMVEQFDGEKKQMVSDHIVKMADLEMEKEKVFQAMKAKMQKQIDDLLRELALEKENSAGSTKDLREKMQREIDELKKQL